MIKILKRIGFVFAVGAYAVATTVGIGIWATACALHYGSMIIVMPVEYILTGDTLFVNNCHYYLYKKIPQEYDRYSQSIFEKLNPDPELD